MAASCRSTNEAFLNGERGAARLWLLGCRVGQQAVRQSLFQKRLPRFNCGHRSYVGLTSAVINGQPERADAPEQTSGLGQPGNGLRRPDLGQGYVLPRRAYVRE